MSALSNLVHAARASVAYNRERTGLRESLTGVEALLDHLERAHDTGAEIAWSIHLGIAAEEHWDGPSVKPGDLTDEQIVWLGAWLAGEGWTR